MNLNEWAKRFPAGEEMIWAGAAGRQMVWVGDHLCRVVGGTPEVIGTHRSKSIDLPVYLLQSDGVKFIARNNFHNWKLSVMSDEPVVADFTGLFHTSPPTDPGYTGNPLVDCYFDGFPAEYIFGYYAEDNRRWSAEIHSDGALWTTVFLTMRALGNVALYEFSRRPQKLGADGRGEAALLGRGGGGFLGHVVLEPVRQAGEAGGAFDAHGGVTGHDGPEPCAGEAHGAGGMGEEAGGVGGQDAEPGFHLAGETFRLLGGLKAGEGPQHVGAAEEGGVDVVVGRPCVAERGREDFGPVAVDEAVGGGHEVDAEGRDEQGHRVAEVVAALLALGE